MKQTIYALVGPTAVGKSAVAGTIAEPLNAEIISVDSMQVYRGMDIGTSKPDPVERKKTRYHMIDIVDPNEDFSAAGFKDYGTEALMDIFSRNKKPLLVGGSGLYFRALVDDLDFSGLRTTRSSRADLESEFDGVDNYELHQILAGVDSEAAGKIDAQNRRRILRAIEVARSGDHLISTRQKSWEEFDSPYELKAAGLEMDRNLLYRLIEQRVDRMIGEGFVDEVKILMESETLNINTTAGEAIGYKQIMEYINGEASLEEAKFTIKKKSRNYAKRQITWFKKDHRIKWFKIEARASDPREIIEIRTEETAREILEYLRP